MSSDLIDTLPLPQRLALSYAPAAARPATLAVLALDRRLAGVVIAGGEPMLAQIKLAWWRDRLGEPSSNWPKGEPLLAALRDSAEDWRGLVSLVDGWEVLLSDNLGPPEYGEFAVERAGMWRELARLLNVHGADVEAPARTWALADLAFDQPPGEGRDAIAGMVTAQELRHVSLPRALRPLAVLHALARRALSGHREALLDGPAAMVLAMRVGISGR